MVFVLIFNKLLQPLLLLLLWILIRKKREQKRVRERKNEKDFICFSFEQRIFRGHALGYHFYHISVIDRL